MNAKFQRIARLGEMRPFGRTLLGYIFIVPAIVLLLVLTFGNNPAPDLSMIVLYLLYMLLMFTQPRPLLWSRWRFTYTYLLTIFFLTVISGFFTSLFLRILSNVVVFGVVIQASEMVSKRGLILLLGAVSAAFLIDVLLLQVLALSPIPQLTTIQLGLWLLGLAFVHTLTGLGAQERQARLRNEDLVQELTATQEQLRLQAAHAEDLAIMSERARVAREMHDTLAQGLAAIKMHLEAGCALFEQQPESAYSHMMQARLLSGEHLQETRKTILTLREDSLEGQSLSSALASLATGAEGSCCAVICQISPSVESLALPSAMQLACYRIAQEALQNATRHGQAGQVTIELSLESDELCLTVTDDGRGFDPPGSPLPGSRAEDRFGLVGMRERAALLSGRLEVVSAPGAGTQIAAMIPLPQASRVQVS